MLFYVGLLNANHHSFKIMIIKSRFCKKINLPDYKTRQSLSNDEQVYQRDISINFHSLIKETASKLKANATKLNFGL